MFKIRSNSSSARSAVSVIGAIMPALLKAASSLPYTSTVRSIAAFTCSADETSHVTAIASSPFSFI